MTYLGLPIGYFSKEIIEHGEFKWLHLIPEETKWNTQWVDISKPENYSLGYYSLPIRGVMCFYHDGTQFKTLDWIYRMCKFPYSTEDPCYKDKFYVGYEAYKK